MKTKYTVLMLFKTNQNWFILDNNFVNSHSNNMNKISSVTKLSLKTFLAAEIAGSISGLENTKGNVITR